ncbi:MAG: hypothetical protein J0H98_09040 [Solirubrobacterales bacterium]|nr:hypothetical protein [Solirubrobacterales bacterium]
MAALVATAVMLIASAGQAAASTASFEKVSGKPTLVLVAKKREENVIYLTYQAGAKTIELRDTGDGPGYTDIHLTYDEKSLPGCEFTRDVDSFGDPSNEQVTCPAGKVKQVLLLLGDKDDSLFAGDQTYESTKPRMSVFARGGKGNDIMIGGRGNDYLFGDAGRDIVEGGKGNDSINGGAGQDSISGDGQYTADRPPARGGNDLLVAGAGNDYVYPGSGRDKVSGGAGKDIVSSVADRDRDFIDCGAGRHDSLLGVDHRGIRFSEKLVSGCETVGSGLFGGVAWECHGRRCAASISPYAREEDAS